MIGSIICWNKTALPVKSNQGQNIEMWIEEGECYVYSVRESCPQM
jgi:hypothetical protein